MIFKLKLCFACLFAIMLWGQCAYAETIRVEAENYVNAYDTNTGNANTGSISCTYKGLNVDVYSTTDGNSGCTIGFIVSGEWLEYTINPEHTANYRLVVRYSSQVDGAGNRTVVFKKGGATLTSISMPQTTGYGNYQNFEAIIPLTAGSQTIRMEFTSSWFNVNYFDLILEEVDITDNSTYRIEAEDYNVGYDVSVGSPWAGGSCEDKGLEVDIVTSGQPSGCKVGSIEDTEWLEYAVNVAQTGVYRLAYKTSSGNSGSRGFIQFRSNGSTLATTEIFASAGWEVFDTYYATVALTAGFHVIRLYMNGWFFDFDYFELQRETVDIVGDSNYRFEAEDYVAAYDTAAGNLLVRTDDDCPYYEMGVDIGDSKDGGGCTLGYIANGEWVEFSINVAEAGNYTVDYRYANNTGGPSNGGQIAFKSNGTTKATTTITPITGGWDLYKNLTDTVNLSTGLQTIRLQFTNPYVNLNWFSLQKVAPAAAGCTFPSGFATASNGGVINMNYGARVNDSPSNQLNTKNLTISGGADSCGLGIDCTKTDTTASAFTDIPTIPAGSNYTLAADGSASVSPGAYGSMSIGSRATLNMAPGDYTFNGNVDFQSESNLIISSAGVVRFFINGRFVGGSSSRLNNGGGSTEFLFIYASADFDFQYDVKGYLVGYAATGITSGTNNLLYGALTTAANITAHFGSVVNYDASQVTGVGEGTTCGAPPELDSTVAVWRFDEAFWTGVTDEVQDSGSLGLHANTVNAGSQPTPAYSNRAIMGDPGTCFYGNFADGNGYVTIADPGEGSVFDSPEYTVAGWFYPTSYPSSDVYSLATKGGYFGIHLRTNGTLQIDWDNNTTIDTIYSTGTLPLNTWTHVAFTFSYSQQKIYINGALDSTHTVTNGYLFNDDALLIGYDQSPTTRGFRGFVDEFSFFNENLSGADVAAAAAETHSCPIYNTPTTIAVSVDSTASTCAPESVTFTVLSEISEPVTGYTGVMTIGTSTGRGNWLTTGTPADAYGVLSAGSNDSGAASYTFDESDFGSVTLALSNGHTESLSVSAVESTNGAAGASNGVSYSTNGFSDTDITGGARVVGYPQVWRISMMTKDPVTGDCSVNTDYAQVGVKVWAVRGSADPGGAAASLTDTATSSTVTLPSSEPGSNNFNLTFVNGVAEFTLNTTDVLQHTVYIADKTRAFADVDLVTDIGEKTFAPFGFAVTASGNPGSSTAAGVAYKAAGQDFTVNVTAVAWAADDDVDNNKIPDGHDSAGVGTRANLTNNSAIASFGQESPAESITLSANLLLPSGGNNAGLGDADPAANDARIITSFAGGAGSTSQVYYNEVGIIELKAEITDGQYMGASIGESVYSDSYSGNVGRFTPANFIFSGGLLTEPCQVGTDFSYMGQTFAGEFTVAPQSSLGGGLQNYTGDFAKLALGDFDFVARDAITTTTLTSRLAGTATAIGWSGASGTVDANITLARTTAPDGPYTMLTVGVDFADSDGIALVTASKDFDADGDTTNDSAALGQTDVRFGRISLADAHGPETAILSVPLLVEYWQSPNWLTNADDSCTAIARSDIYYPAGSIDTSGNRTVTVGGGSTVGSYDSIVGDAVMFIAGDAGHQFSASGTGNTGNFNTYIDLTNYPWLRFDWNADGDYSDSQTPENQINFGTYRGHDRILFWQEL